MFKKKMKIKILLSLLFLILVNGCGTIESRFKANNMKYTNGFEDGCYCIGKYPYQATYVDYKWMCISPEESPVPHEASILQLIGFISIPLDFIFDTVLVIPDLIVWPLGIHKFDMEQWEKEHKKWEEDYKKQKKEEINKHNE